MQYTRDPDDNQVNTTASYIGSQYGVSGASVEHFREVKKMAAGRCDICERKPMYGNNVPFSQHRTRRRFVLNVQRRRLEVNGTMKNVNICTRCLRTMSKLPKVR
jgi:large subunit ribosomal protein L28